MKSSKVILITGGSSGIGFDAARTLALRGHKVYAAARRVEAMEPLRGDGVTPIRLDITVAEERRRCVETVIAAEGRIDVLVNNAGYGYFGAVENVTEAEARAQLEVNLFGLAELCRLVLPQMRSQHSGRIVNVSSVAGRTVLYFGGWYHVSKYAVEALSDAMRMELKPFDIDVALIEPGGIRTSWGTIAADHLSESSLGTPYEKDALDEAALMYRGYTSNFLSDPKVVTRTIRRAAEARRPRVRYHPGLGSRLLLVLHAILPARWWDAMLRGAVRTVGPKCRKK